MKRLLILFALVFSALPAFATQTWFVRADGGTRFSTNVPTGQCNGKADVAYPGSGTNQNCAFNDFRYLWDDDGRTGGLGAWVIAGGDTVVVRGCHALATQSNPANPTCRIGWDQNNGGAGNSWCFAIGNQACSNPPIPAGTSSAHTRILGGCAFDGTPCTPINNNYPYGTTNETQIFAGFGLQYGFVLSNTSFVDISGIEFTTHNGACSHGFAPGYPHACNTSTPEDFADNGITFASVTADTPAHDITLTDVYVHGFSSSGLFGPVGANITLTRVFSGFNGFAGFNFNDNSNDTNGVNASIAASFTTWIGNGCTEQYPIVNTQYPALGCWDSNSGGFGDALSGQSCLFSVSATCVFVNFTFDHGLVAYNTKDGFIGPHVPYNNMSITNSRFYGNMGQQLKYGGNPNSTLLLQNNFIEGNCLRMSQTLPGAVQNFNQSTGLPGSYLTGFCRAAGNIVDTLTQIGSVNHYYGNIFVINGQDGLQFDCGPVGGGATNCGSVPTIFSDNIFLTYVDPAFGTTPTLYNINVGTNITVTTDHAIEIGANGQDPCSGTIHCVSPQLVSQPTLPWPSGGQTAFDSFNFSPSGSSPALGAGIAIAGMTTDFFGAARPNPPAIGAAELSGAPTLVSIAVTPNPGSVVVASTLSMVCTSTFSDSSTAPCSSPVWTDTNTHSSINSSTGVVTGASAGADTVTATIGSISGNATVNVSALPVVATPTGSPAAGTFTSTQSVTLSDATSGAAICFTNDGTTPTAPVAGTCSGGTTQTYSAAITVATTTTIKAIGTKAANTNSGVFSGLYTITPPVTPVVQVVNIKLSGGGVTIP